METHVPHPSTRVWGSCACVSRVCVSRDPGSSAFTRAREAGHRCPGAPPGPHCRPVPASRGAAQVIHTAPGRLLALRFLWPISPFTAVGRGWRVGYSRREGGGAHGYSRRGRVCFQVLPGPGPEPELPPSGVAMRPGMGQTLHGRLAGAAGLQSGRLCTAALADLAPRFILTSNTEP